MDRTPEMISRVLVVLVNLGVVTSAKHPSCTAPIQHIRLDPGEQTLIWRDSGDRCANTWTWALHVTAPEGQAILLEIHDVTLGRKEKVKISGHLDSSSMPLTLTRTSAHNWQPYIFYSNQLSIMLNGTSTKTIPRINATIFTAPLASFPERVYLKRDANDIGSQNRFNCSSSPDVRIPPALRCDMVVQCVDGDDEAGCHYKHPGCGDWIPFQDRCLRFVFSHVRYHRALNEYLASPLQAEKSCQDDYDATLLQLTERPLYAFVAQILKRSGFRKIVIGLRKMKTTSKTSQRLYRFLWQWGGVGGQVAYDAMELQHQVGTETECATFSARPAYGFRNLRPEPCSFGSIRPNGYLCSKPNPHLRQPHDPTPNVVALPAPKKILTQMRGKQCADGSFVHSFYSCPHAHRTVAAPLVAPSLVTTSLPGREPLSSPVANAAPTHDTDAGVSPRAARVLPQFRCRYGPGVHYALVCDGYGDCVDDSDELDCRPPRGEALLNASFVCGKVQAVARVKRCNGHLDCHDGSDEEDCMACRSYPGNFGTIGLCHPFGCIPELYMAMFQPHCPTIGMAQAHPYKESDWEMVVLDGYGMSDLLPMGGPGRCPDSHYQCPGDWGLCIPTFMLNNGERDCPGGRDENIAQVNLTCPGFYRCYLSHSCVHPTRVCDGVPHCPHGDDELFCDLACPAACQCQGHALTCTASLPRAADFLHLRYLDLSGVPRPALAHLGAAEFLHFLNLSSCRLASLALGGLRHLQVLDVSRNALSELTAVTFQDLPNLRVLDLSHNALGPVLGSGFSAFLSTASCVNLRTLVVVNISLRHLQQDAFTATTDIELIELQGNAIETFSMDVFADLERLGFLRADSSRLCCALPESRASLCQAPRDHLSSCSDLLRLDLFRALFWMLASLSLSGNIVVLVYRVLVKGGGGGKLGGYRVLVLHLCVSDALMGGYLLLIGVADTRYRGDYISQDWRWRNSIPCTVAGVLALLSSEVSAFVLSLLTADRVLALCFPLRPNLRMTRLGAHVSCGVAWGVGGLLATLPLLPPTRHWHFYSQSSICVPLPGASAVGRFSGGHGYSFAVFIVLNFVLFCVIGCGQAVVFGAVVRTRRSAAQQTTDLGGQQSELRLARRLFLVAFSDFCCWFPIGVTGLLAAGGAPIPGPLTVWLAVFVLPLNSALNPFLYTLNAASQKRRAERERKRLKSVLRNIQTEVDTWSSERVQQLVRHCVRTKLAGVDVTQDQASGRGRHSGPN